MSKINRSEMKYIEKIFKAGKMEAFDMTNPENLDDKFFLYTSVIIENLKKESFVSSDAPLKDCEMLFLTAYCMGKAVQKEKQKEPMSSYFKDHDHIFIEFDNNGQKQVTNVPKDWNNKDIKKVLSHLCGQEFKGNFRKMSEIETRRVFKNLDEIT